MSATAARAVPRAHRSVVKREYVVLCQIRGDGGDARAFEEIGLGVGSNDVEAIRDATKAMTPAERSAPFVAIAKSRFNVRTRKVETVEREHWH